MQEHRQKGTEYTIPLRAFPQDVTTAAASGTSKQRTDFPLLSRIRFCALDKGTVKPGAFIPSAYTRPFRIGPPIHTIKIDRTFVSQICENSRDAVITEAIIAMAHKLNLTVVAEGVETEEQKEFLTKQGCELAQGFLFSKPLLAEEFLKLLKQ
ncbi:MAG: EAL domain-containing protein [bacterium]